MKERPIIFSGEMVQAILEGRKTQTRRVIKPGKYWWGGFQCKWYGIHPGGGWHGVGSSYEADIPEYAKEPCGDKGFPCPYGQIGDRLWVRERWWMDEDEQPVIFYTATDKWSDIPMKSSIFMPRWASRITLEIINIRVERVQDISSTAAKAEGIQALQLQDENDPSAWWESAPGVNQARTAVWSFQKLWDSINTKRGYSWEPNPWVWVIEFKRIDENQGVARYAPTKPTGGAS
jgi:hypothetical protein